jgi:hypothetical protein
MVYGEEKNILDQLKQPGLGKNLLFRHEEPNESAKEGSHSIVLLEVPFASVSTVSRSKPSLQRNNTKNLKQIFPEKELCGHAVPSPSFHMHMSLSDPGNI